MSKVVFSDILRVICCSNKAWNLGHMMFPGVRVGYDLVFTDESFCNSMIDKWSEERSSEFLKEADMWFGRVVIKKSRISGCLLWIYDAIAIGQYVGYCGEKMFRALFTMRLFSARPLVLKLFLVSIYLIKL